MKYEVRLARGFKRDYKRIYQSVIAEKVDKAINLLENGEKLPFRFHDHALKGEFAGLRELYVCPDLLLVYKKQDDILILTCLRIASHADIFGK